MQTIPVVCIFAPWNTVDRSEGGIWMGTHTHCMYTFQMLQSEKFKFQLKYQQFKKSDFRQCTVPRNQIQTNMDFVDYIHITNSMSKLLTQQVTLYYKIKH